MAIKLEIHVVNVGFGDATVIAVKNDDKVIKNVLVDFGETSKDFINCYMTEFGLFKEVKKKEDTEVDLLILTHYHSDHVDGCGQFAPATFGKCLHPGNNLLPAHFFATGVNVASTFLEFGKNIDPLDKNAFFYQKAAIRPLVYELYPGIVLKIVCGAGTTLSKDGKSIEKCWLDKMVAVDPNEMSIGFVIECEMSGKGPFRYFGGGDIGDANTKKLAGKINKVDVMKANHHGSRAAHGVEYNTPEFLKELKPTHTIVTSGAKWDIPDLYFLETLDECLHSDGNKPLNGKRLWVVNPLNSTWSAIDKSQKFGMAKEMTFQQYVKKYTNIQVDKKVLYVQNKGVAVIVDGVGAHGYHVEEKGGSYSDDDITSCARLRNRSSLIEPAIHIDHMGPFREVLKNSSDEIMMKLSSKINTFYQKPDGYHSNMLLTGYMKSSPEEMDAVVQSLGEYGKLMVCANVLGKAYAKAPKKSEFKKKKVNEFIKCAEASKTLRCGEMSVEEFESSYSLLSKRYIRRENNLNEPELEPRIRKKIMLVEDSCVYDPKGERLLDMEQMEGDVNLEELIGIMAPEKPLK